MEFAVGGRLGRAVKSVINQIIADFGYLDSMLCLVYRCIQDVITQSGKNND